MAFGGAIDIFGHRVMGELGNRGVTVVAGDIFMQASGIYMLIDVVIMAFAVLVDSSDKPVSVTLQALLLVQGRYIRAEYQTKKDRGTIK